LLRNWKENPRQRLAIALLLSMAGHLALSFVSIYFSPGQYPTRPRGEVQALNVTLTPVTQAVPAQPAEAVLNLASEAVDSAPQPEIHLAPQAEVDRNNAADESGLISPAQYQSATWLSRRPIPLFAITPQYPPDVEGIAGKVSLILYINEQGRVDNYKVLHAEPPGIFEQASISAFSKARYAAGRMGERLVKSQFVVEVTFEPGEEPRIESAAR
jgi:TonB family protein